MNAGADVAFSLKSNWKQQVLDFTSGKGVDVAYDSVGSTLMDSFEITKALGHVVFYGMSGGDPAFIDPKMLMDPGKTLSGGDLWAYLSSREERIRRSWELFRWIMSGKVKTTPPVRYKLSEGHLAHEFLESGLSSGKVLLMP